MTDDRTMLDVPVAGGTLRVARHPGSGPAVLALHGVTASHVMFDPIAEQLAGQVDLIVPDLRGRGASSGLPGPFGMRAHVADYDLTGTEPELRSRVDGAAVRADSADILADQHVCTAYERLRCPTVWMRAERGMFDEIPPLYPDARARQVLAANPHLGAVAMVGVNHYTMVLGDAGAAMVADQVRAATGVAGPASRTPSPQPAWSPTTRTSP